MNRTSHHLGYVHFACGRDTIIIVQTMDLTGGEDLSIGSEISFAFGGNAVHVFNKESGENLEFI